MKKSFKLIDREDRKYQREFKKKVKEKEKGKINKDKPKKINVIYLNIYLNYLKVKIKKFLKHKVN